MLHCQRDALVGAVDRDDPNGDDIPDLECMRIVGIPVCPADACMEVIEASRYVSEFDGGRGAVRDIVEQVLRAQDKWAKNTKGVLGVASR